MSARPLFDEAHVDARLDHAGEFLCIPIGQTHAAMALGLADGRGFGRSVDAVGGLGQCHPHGADGTIRSGRNLQDLVIVALLEIDFRIVGIARIGCNSLNGDVAGGGRRVRRADGCGVGGHQLAAGIVGANLLAALVGDDAGDSAGPVLACRHNLDLDTGQREVDIRIERLEIGLVHVEPFRQHLHS